MKVLSLRILALLTAMAVGVFISGVVQASHNFSDVPTAAFYHNAVEWIFNRGITAGCAPGLYCPNDPVTRGTMAVFLQKEGVALTPRIVAGGGNSGAAVDPDTSPVVCTTGAFPDYTPTFPQRARYQNFLSLEAAGAMSIVNYPVYSTNGGASWIGIASFGGGGPVGGAASAQWFSTTAFASLSLTPGTTYRFGVQVARATGTADATNSRCELMVEVVNWNSD